MPSYFSSLPNELMLEILNKLEPDDLHNFMEAFPKYKSFYNLVLKDMTEGEKCIICIFIPRCYVNEKPIALFDITVLALLIILFAGLFYCVYRLAIY